MKNIGKRTVPVSGYVEYVISDVSKYGGYAHRITVKEKKYSLFNDSKDCFFKQGDLVRFGYIRAGEKYKYNKIVEETMFILNPAESEVRISGYVYVLSNKSMPGLLKIGYTTRSPDERANELYQQATGVPDRFNVEWFLSISNGNPELVEKKVHALLSKKRVGKEFFNISVDLAKEKIIEAYQSIYPDGRSDNYEDYQKKRKEELAASNKDKEFVSQKYEKIQPRGIEEKKSASIQSDKDFNPIVVYTKKLQKFIPSKRSWIDKILGRGSLKPDSISAYISGEPNYLGHVIWTINVSGSYQGEVFKDTKTFGSSDAENYFFQLIVWLESVWNRYAIMNTFISFNIESTLVRNRNQVKQLQTRGFSSNSEKFFIGDLSWIHIEGLNAPMTYDEIINSALSSLPVSRVREFQKAWLD